MMIWCVGVKQYCRDTVMGWEYMGKVNVTKHGEACQAWASQTPHSHRFTGKSFLSHTYATHTQG